MTTWKCGGTVEHAERAQMASPAVVPIASTASQAYA